MASRLEIFNLALLNLGEDTQTSENNIEHIPYIYEQVVRDLLSKNSFDFSIREEKLVKINDDKYQLPSDLLYLIKSNFDGKVIEDYYLLEEENDNRDVIISYIKRVDEKYFPPFFVNLLSLALARKVADSYNVRGEISSQIESKYLLALSTSENADYKIDFGRRLYW